MDKTFSSPERYGRPVQNTSDDLEVVMAALSDWPLGDRDRIKQMAWNRDRARERLVLPLTPTSAHSLMDILCVVGTPDRAVGVLEYSIAGTEVVSYTLALVPAERGKGHGPSYGRVFERWFFSADVGGTVINARTLPGFVPKLTTVVEFGATSQRDGDRVTVRVEKKDFEALG